MVSQEEMGRRLPLTGLLGKARVRERDVAPIIGPAVPQPGLDLPQQVSCPIYRAAATFVVHVVGRIQAAVRPPRQAERVAEAPRYPLQLTAASHRRAQDGAVAR